MKENKLCRCGCGNTVTFHKYKKSDYIRGHNNRGKLFSKKSNKKHSDTLKKMFKSGGLTVWNKDCFSINDRPELFKKYWDELLTEEEIAKLYNVSKVTIKRAFERLGIETRTATERTKLLFGGRHFSQKKSGKSYWILPAGYEHRIIIKTQLGRELKSNEMVHHKDFCSLNNHPLNLKLTENGEHKKIHYLSKDRPLRSPMYEVYMRMAEQISGRSTCIRLSTGSVITSHDLQKVYSVGFNGNIKGGVNSCNGIEGQCGCIHSEENALLKIGVGDKNKILFCTHSPCKGCAKKIIQSGFSDIFYRNEYRDNIPIKFLHYYDIRTCKYDIWKDY